MLHMVLVVIDQTIFGWNKRYKNCLPQQNTGASLLTPNVVSKKAKLNSREGKIRQPQKRTSAVARSLSRYLKGVSTLCFR